MQSFIETWHINNRVNLFLLDAISEENLADISASKGRNVGQQFAHIHNVRLMWIKASAPDLLNALTPLDKVTKLTKALLAEALNKSADAIATLLQKSFDDGKVKNFKPHPAAFFGYLISHEGHHRGQIMLSLKQSGHAVDKKVQYGLWEWGSR